MSRAIRTVFRAFYQYINITIFHCLWNAIGTKIDSIEGISYGAFIIPGLIMLTVITQSLSNASFGIFMPKYTNLRILSAPISPFETIAGYVGAALANQFLLD